MKIIINGIEYELTYAEMRETYEIMKEEYLKEDVKCKAEEMKIELSEEDIDYVASMAQKGIDNNDSYWECYWMAIEYALEDL